MIIQHIWEIEKKPVAMEGAENVSIQWLIGKETSQAPFYMRLFEVEAGGHTPFHHHEGGHEIYILSGQGRLRTEKGFTPLTPGTFALILAGEMHSFENTGGEKFQFLCLIPR